MANNKNLIGKVKKIISSKSAVKYQGASGGLYAGFEKFFDVFPFPAYVRDRGGEILAANPLACELLGLSGPQAVLDDDSLGKDLAAEKKIFKSAKPQDCDFAYTDTNGSSRHARVVKTPVKDNNGSVSAVVTFFEDITERKAQEDEILNNKILFQNILDYAPMAIYTRPVRGGVSFWNKKTEEIYEESSSGFIENKVHDNQTPQEASAYISREEQILKEGKVVEYPQEPYKTKRGNDIMLHLIKVPIPAAGNNPPLVLTIAQDITERYHQEAERIRTQNILQTIFNSAPVAIYARDDKGELIFRNKKTLETHGCISEFEMHETKDQREFYKKRERDILKSGKPLEIPAEEYTGADGKTRTLQVIKAPVYDTDGKPLMVISICQDISDKRAKEHEIALQKAFLLEVLDNLPIAVFAKKYGGGYIMWNKKSEEIYGAKAEDVLGKTHYGHSISRDQEEFIREQEEKLFESRSEMNIEQELIPAAKEGIKIMHTVKTPLYFNDGTPNCLLGVSEDITAKTKMERQVYESRAKYSLLVENSREAILLIERGRITFANKTLLKDLGYGDEELNGKDLADLAAPDNMEAVLDFYEKSLSGIGKEEYTEIKLNPKNGRAAVDFEASAAVSKYLGKKILIIFLRNISKERRMEKIIKSSEDKFHRVFEESSTPLIILQQNGYVYDMNRAARAIFSFTEEDKPIYSSVYIKPGLSLAARRAMERLDPYTFEGTVDFDKLRGVLPDISQAGAVDLSVKMTPINQRNNGNGEPVADYLLEIHKKGEGAPANLADIKMLNGSLFYHDAVVQCNKDGVIIQANAPARGFFGSSGGKIEGRSVYGYFDFPHDEALQADIRELYNKKDLRDKAYEIKIGKSFVPVEVTGAVLSNNDFLLSIRNVSARRQLNDLLKERSEHLDALAKVVDGALFECNIKDNIFYPFSNVNDKAVALTGLTKKELLSMSLTDALTDKEGKERKKVLLFLAGKAGQLKADKVVSFDARLRFGEREVFASVRITGYEMMGLQKAIIIIRDTTKERILENELDYKLKELAVIKDVLPGLFLKVNAKGVIQEYQTSDLRFNISVFPSDFVGTEPGSYLDKETTARYLDAIAEVMNTGVTLHTSFYMKYGTENRFYEAAISPVKDEANVIVMVNAVDRRKGLENKIKELYAISSNREAGFVKNMDDILEFGKQIFGADIGLILHFSGENRSNILINYATKNDFGLVKGIETRVDECYEAVRSGHVFACGDVEALQCKEGCLHKTKEQITSMLSAPLLISGRVEGAITFLSMNPNRLAVTEEDKSFMDFVGGLMSMALELRSAKKAVDTGLSTLKKLIASLDVPAVITDVSFRIKNANPVMLNITGCYDIIEIEDKNFFARFSTDELKAQTDFKSAYKASKRGVFNMDFDLILSDGKTQNLLWNIVEIKDSKGYVRGFLFVSESVKDMPAVKNLLGGPVSHF